MTFLPTTSFTLSSKPPPLSTVCVMGPQPLVWFLIVTFAPTSEVPSTWMVRSYTSVPFAGAVMVSVGASGFWVTSTDVDRGP